MRQLSPTSSKTVNQASIWLLIAQFLVFSEQTAVGVAGSADSAASQASRQIPTLLTTALACSQLFLGYGSTELSALLWPRREVLPKELWPYFSSSPPPNPTSSSSPLLSVSGLQCRHSQSMKKMFEDNILVYYIFKPPFIFSFNFGKTYCTSKFRVKYLFLNNRVCYYMYKFTQCMILCV